VIGDRPEYGPVRTEVRKGKEMGSDKEQWCDNKRTWVQRISMQLNTDYELDQGKSDSN
jgi:hypothetical protein